MLYSLSGTRRFCKADPCKANLNRLWVFLTVWIQMKLFLRKVNFPEKFHSNPDRWKHSWTTLIRPSSAPCTTGFPVPSRYFFFCVRKIFLFKIFLFCPFLCVYIKVLKEPNNEHIIRCSPHETYFCALRWWSEPILTCEPPQRVSKPNNLFIIFGNGKTLTSALLEML